MQSKFYTLASNFLFLCLFASVGHAQTPSPTPKVGYIRFWNMLPPTNGTFEVRNANAGPTEESLLTASAYKYSSYTAFPEARYRLAVVKKGEAAALKIFEVDLKQDTFFTILISPRSIDMFSDAQDPNADSGRLMIRNFFPGANISALINSKQVTESLPYGQSYEAGGLSLDRAVITLRAKLPSGVPSESSVDFDFKTSKRATVLIIPDSYGRLRPRITIDGKNF